MAQDQLQNPDRTAETRGLWASTVTVAALVSVLYLAILVLLHRPLPIHDLATAGLAAVGFGLICLLALIFGLRLQVFSFPVVFMVGAFLVSLSAFMIYPFDGELAFSGFLVLYPEALRRGLPVVMLAMASLTLGAAIAQLRTPAIAPQRPPVDPWKVETTHRVALILYWIFFAGVMLFSLRGPGILTSITAGYTGGEGFSDLRKAGEFPAIFTTSLQWFLPWLSVILLATSRNKRQFAWATVMAAIACGLTLLIGKRTVAIIVIALLMQIRFLRGYPLHWRRIAVLGVVAWFIILTWPAIRVIPVKDWRPSVIMEALQTRHIPGDFGEEKSSPVREAFGGFAPSYQPIMVSCHWVPEYEPYRLGFDYLRSAIVAVPFASRTFRDYLSMDQMPDVWMMNKIDPGFWTARAFNQIGEAYLQGGWVTVTALYLLLGLYMTRMWRRLADDPDPRALAFHALVMFGIYKWVRLESGPVGRTILWAVILVYLLPALYRWATRLFDSPPASGELPAPSSPGSQGVGPSG